jgi:hypothetical protein
MKLTNLNSSSLRSLIKLTDRKEALVLEIKKIDEQLATSVLGNSVQKIKRQRRAAVAPTKKSKTGSGKRVRRGALKTKIFSALRAAGEAGLKVPVLSKKIGVKSQNVHVWFSSTGKKIPEIKRIGKGQFKLQEKEK